MFAVEHIDCTMNRLRTNDAELIGEVVQYEDKYRLCYLRGPAAVIRRAGPEALLRRSMRPSGKAGSARSRLKLRRSRICRRGRRRHRVSHLGDDLRDRDNRSGFARNLMGVLTFSCVGFMVYTYAALAPPGVAFTSVT